MGMKGVTIFGRLVSWWWIATVLVFMSVFIVSIQEPTKPQPVVCCKCCNDLKNVCCDNNDCLGS